jgi:adenylate cyclase
MERRLAAILAADMVGYSRLMSSDEASTLSALKACRKEIFEPQVTAQGGRIVKLTGDGLLVEFPSAVEAVRCAADIQTALRERETDGFPAHFRIGVNLGDIIVEDGDIYGDGVNVASRLEGLAEPGGVCVSATVVDHVRGKVDLTFESMGKRKVKNQPMPLEIFRLSLGALSDATMKQIFETSIGLDFSLPKEPSIAVLPFTVMGNDPEQEFFADGVAEDIITALSKVDRLMVVARNSSFTYKGRAVDVKEVSRQQGVRYVLEGSVRMAGGRVRLTAQLIDATTGLHIWAERYERNLDDIFAVQDEITREIVIALDVRMREGEQHRIWSKGTRNLQAWECVRMATDAVIGGDEKTRPMALELIEKALSLDPDYAIAWVMRGWIYWTEADVGGGLSDHHTRFDDAQANTFRCVYRALELDPDCADAYGLLAMTHLNAKKFDQAIEASEKAITLAPSSVELIGGIASPVMTKSGLPERGAQLAKQAMRLCPFYRPGLLRSLGMAYRTAGRLEDAITCFRESIKRESGWLGAYVNLAATLGELEWLDDAREVAGEVLAREPNFSISNYVSGLSYRDPIEIDRIANGLRTAGLPE